MRISDWSSDVCSSDLAGRLILKQRMTQETKGAEHLRFYCIQRYVKQLSDFLVTELVVSVQQEDHSAAFGKQGYVMLDLLVKLFCHQQAIGTGKGIGLEVAQFRFINTDIPVFAFPGVDGLIFQCSMQISANRRVDA